MDSYMLSTVVDNMEEYKVIYIKGINTKLAIRKYQAGLNPFLIRIVAGRIRIKRGMIPTVKIQTMVKILSMNTG